MSKVLQRVELSLRSFYIYKSDLADSDDQEHKKILYYYPDVELNTKMRDVGLSEAIVAFTSNFMSSEDNCQALHTQKTTQLFHQPEAGYWMVLVLNVPREIKMKDGIESTDYRGGDVSDRIFRAVLKQCYYKFRFFYGALQSHLSTGSENERLVLCENLQSFFDKYLHTLKLYSCDILNLLPSVQFLALDKSLFLRAHNFVNILCLSFPIISDTILLYNESVICSGSLCAEDLHSLHEYILRDVRENDPVELSNTRRRSSNNTGVYEQGAFVTPASEDGCNNSRTAYLYMDKITRPYQLVIYRCSALTLCIFLEVIGNKGDINEDLYKELHAYMGQQLKELALDITEQNSKPALVASAGCFGGTTNDNSNAAKYLFINEQNITHYTNICRSKVLQHIIPRNVMNIIADLASPRSDLLRSIEEVQVKTTDDFWIVKRNANWRQYYVILTNNKSTLLEVTQEAKRIFNQELTDDVFFEK